MPDHFFISYSTIDGKKFALNLADNLTGFPPHISISIDKYNLIPGEDWDEQIANAIRDCKGLIFIMTKDSVNSKSVCKNEWVRALRYKKPIIPLLFNEEAELPFRLESREYIDFTGSFDAALSRLRVYLTEMDTTKGQLRALLHRREDAQRDLTRAETPEKEARISEDISRLEAEIKELQQILEDPKGTSQRTEQRISTELQREREPDILVDEQSLFKYVYPLPSNAPLYFQNRHVETQLIEDFLKDDAKRLLVVAGRGGTGKTTMICRILKSLESGRMPDDGASIKVTGAVCLSAIGSHRVRFTELYLGLSSLLKNEVAQMLDGILKNSHLSIEAKMQPLLEAFSTGCTIVLLDNFESIVDVSTNDITDSELHEALHAILKLPQHAVKIIITTQIVPQKILFTEPGRQMTVELDTGLDSPYAENILRAMDRDGKMGLKNAPADLLTEARMRTRGYPRALEALFAILAADRDTTLKELLNDTRKLLPDNVTEVLIGEAFSRLDLTSQNVIKALAIFARPVPPTAIDYLLQPYIPGINSSIIVKRLVNMHFVRREAGYYYLHQFDCDYAVERIPTGQPDDWLSQESQPYTRYSLLHRGADYFRDIQRRPSTWKSVEDLNPVIAEYDLLIRAGDYEAALEVLDAMLPFVEKWGNYRQLERLSKVLAKESKPPISSIAMGLTGRVLYLLGEDEQAIEYFNQAINETVSDPSMEQEYSWRLDLADCYLAILNYDAAKQEYRFLLDRTGPEDFITQAEALIGLGTVAKSVHSYDEAEISYMRALQIYVSSQLMQKGADENEFVYTSGVSISNISIADPWAWIPIIPLTFTSPEGEKKKSYLYSIEPHLPFDDNINPKGGNDEHGVVVPMPVYVEVIPELADLWLNFSNLYNLKDEMSKASACGHLAYDIYSCLESHIGIARSLDLIRRLTADLSDEKANAIIEEQEYELQRAKDASHRRAEMALLHNLAETYLERNIGKAEEYFQTMLDYSEQLEDPLETFNAELGLARVEWNKGNHDIAISKLMNLSNKRANDLNTKAEIELTLGRIEESRGQRRKAKGHVISAIRDFSIVGNEWQEVDAQRLLAVIQINDRDYYDAVVTLQSILPLVKSLGTPSITTSVLCDLANAYSKAGNPKMAFTYAGEASDTTANIEVPKTTAEAYLTIANIHNELQQFALAEEHYLKAREVYQLLNDISNEVYVLQLLSYSYRLASQDIKALQIIRLAWEKAKDLTDLLAKRSVKMDLATALSACGFYKEAIDHMETIVEETPNDAFAVGNLGWILYEAGEYDRSLEMSKKAVEMDSAANFVLENIAHAYLAKGCPEEAERAYHRAIEDRKGSENFHDTINIVKKLISKKPETPGSNDMLKLLEEEQQKLEAQYRMQ